MSGPSDYDFTDALQMGCNFLTTWKRSGEDHIEMHCELAELDRFHLWRIIAGLASYAIVVESAVLVLRGAVDESDLALAADEDPRAVEMVQALLRCLLHGPIGGGG